MANYNDLSADDVRNGYRLLLGREPESNEVVDRHVREGQTISGFRERLLGSKEFLQHIRRPISRLVIGNAPISSMQDIEVTGSPAQMRQLFDHLQNVWSHLGDTEPHYSVLSDDRFKPDAIGTNEEQFYRSGKAEVINTIARLKALGVELNSSATALEIGCGVGRVTRYLANHFRRVEAFDISASHLELAESYLSKEVVNNVVLKQLSSLEKMTFPSHDFFYSRIVLQHNPPPIIHLILDRALAALRPNGVAIFQLLTSLEGYSFSIGRYIKEMNEIKNQELHVFPQVRVFDIFRDHGIFPLEIYRDTSVNGLDRVSTTFIARR